MSVQTQLRGDCAVLTFGQGGQNGLLPTLRRDLMAAIDACAGRSDMRAIVLRGAGGVFSAGLDIDEMDSPGSEAEDGLGALCHHVETSPVPIVALLEGVVAGGGLSLALAAHGRIAVPDARLVFPELRLNQMPSGGATQRLPRLAGAQTALRMMLGARAMPVTDPGLARLLSLANTDDPEAEACAMALGQPHPPRRTCDLRMGLSDPKAYLKAVDVASRGVDDPDGAASGIVQAVEAAILLPFEQGLALERTLSEACRRSRAARAARHGLRCKRLVAQALGRAGRFRSAGSPRLRLTGGGSEAADLAVLALDGGWSVELSTAHDAAIVSRVAKVYERAVQRGRLASKDAQARQSRLGATAADAPPPGLTLYLGADEPVDTHAGMALVGAGPATRHPRLWFKPPLLAGGVVELHIPEAASQDTVAAIRHLMARAGRQMVRVPLANGAATGLIDIGAQAVALALMARGIAPERIDQAARALGIATGIVAQMDRVGLDTVRRGQDVFAAQTGWRAENTPLEVMAGAGLDRFLTDAGTGDVPGDLLGQMAQGDPVALSRSEVERAVHAGLANVMLRGLGQGVLPSVAAAEFLATHVLGVAPGHGGVLFQADEVGLLALAGALEKSAAPKGSVLEPQQEWRAMIREGKGFFRRTGQ